MHCISAMMGGSLLLFMCSLALFIASLGPSSYLSTSTSTATINPHVAWHLRATPQWLCGILVLVIIGLITLLLFHMLQACFRPSVSDLARRYEEIALREYVARSGHKPSKTKRAKIKGQAQAKAIKDYDPGSTNYDDSNNSLSDSSDDESDATPAPSRTSNAQAAARRVAAPNAFSANLRLGNVTGMQVFPSLRWESVIDGID